MIILNGGIIRSGPVAIGQANQPVRPTGVSQLEIYSCPSLFPSGALLCPFTFLCFCVFSLRRMRCAITSLGR